jgi:arylsulfatase A-like enzyme
MDTASSKNDDRHLAGRGRLSPKSAILLAVSLGLAAGYLDLAIIVYKKYARNGLKNYANAADFPWTVPLGHVLLVLIPAVVLALASAARPKPMSLRSGAWLLATLAFWSALLRMPFYGVCSLLLAAGLGRVISGRIEAFGLRPRPARSVVLGMLGLLIVLAAVSTGRRAILERRARAGLPAPPPNARNVILIVWDSVRAANLGLYGHERPTTPNLYRWSQRGVRFSQALAPAPWTYPSHCSFFTGHWPFQLVSQWNYSLDAPGPTLAEHLASHGYQTAGFSANTLCCTYETRLDRGFIHFEDYPLTPQSFLSRTVAGSWLLENLVHRGDFPATKWIRIQSRDADHISSSFLDWLRHRRPDRPFFAYLNYFDAHEPYIPPTSFAGRFGIRPQSPRDYQFLLDYGNPGWRKIQNRDLWMARDCYDDCIAFLDDRLGRLLDQLQGQGLLQDTLVIVTSDHGESFGDHGVFLHGNNVLLDEVAVPLVILSPDAPANRIVSEPVSLRDLPATVVDQLGLSADSPFPGHSLAGCWSSTPKGGAPRITPALSEHATETAFLPQSERSLVRRDVQMSLVAQGRQYIRNGFGVEALYDLNRDPTESVNLIDSDEGKPAVAVFRRRLLDILSSNPGSSEVEKAYLTSYRQWLRDLVEQGHGPKAPVSARAGAPDERRE